MARFAYLSVAILSAAAALTGVGAAPLRFKRVVTQTAANFQELEYVHELIFAKSILALTTFKATRSSRLAMVSRATPSRRRTRSS